MLRCNTQANAMATPSNNSKTPGTTVSGRYNTPPLREDLVPRSRMTPEGKQNRKRRGKTKLLLDKRVKPKNLERLNKLEERKQRRRIKLKAVYYEKGKRKNRIG